MLKLNEKMYMYVYTSKYDGQQSFIVVKGIKELEEGPTDLSDWQCYEVAEISEAKPIEIIKQPCKIKYL